MTKNYSLQQTLKTHFGYDSFRPQQEEVIEHLIRKKDAVVLMPTGGGKSICYQLPALVLDGLTLVISPLIALMKDQVQSLEANGVSAAFLNSSLTADEENQITARLQAGAIKLLYVSPERVHSSGFLYWLKGLNPSLIAIDEAHCVSSWGHHFRPEYARLSVIKEHFPTLPVIALTATADRTVRVEIAELLKLRTPQFFIGSFDRPNLSLAVLPGRKKWEQMLKIFGRHPKGTGIIYCNSRKATETVAEKLISSGYSAAFYHAGMKPEDRSMIQDEFMQGKYQIVCATVAFGMGIDKSDIRFIIHYNMPGNLESYYQEIGRAGRDGQPAEAVLFYSYRDVQTHLGFINKIDSATYRKIQTAKLERMQEYAEAQICRRRILLTYFSELPEADCANCDVCTNPPKYFDGTVIAQKALSAIARTNEEIPVTVLIEILRATYSSAVKLNEYDKIKTFGAGREYSVFAWQLFIQQLIQQGYIEIDYKDHYALKLNSLSMRVLKGAKKVRLVTPETIKQRQEQSKEVTVDSSSMSGKRTELLRALKSLRSTIAKEIAKPAFVVFNDATLRDMCQRAPITREDFEKVSGVGSHKADLYGERFISLIRDFRMENKTVAKKGDTAKLTYELFKEGWDVSSIAQKRNIQAGTVYGHLGSMLEQGQPIDIKKLLNQNERMQLESAFDELGEQEGVKPYYEYLEGAVSYGKIKLYQSWKHRGASV